MHSGRFRDAIAERKSGGEPSWKVIAEIGVIVVVPPLIAVLGTAAWFAEPDTQASEPAPEIVSARGRFAESSEPGRLGSVAATRGGSGSSRPSPPAMAAPEPLTAPRAAPVQQPRASVPVLASTPDVRARPRPDDNREPDPAPGKRATEPPMPALPPQPQTRAPVREQASSAVVASLPRRQGDDDRPPDPEAAARAAFKEAFVRVGQTRALAEAADAQNLASGSLQAAVALQREALELSESGRLVDAAGRLVEANGRFRLAEAEARLKAVARDPSPVAGAPTPVPRSPAEPREAPAPPAGSSGVESRPPAPAAVPPAVDVQNAVRPVIAQYVRGLENRSVADLKRVWPSLAGSQERAIQAEFDNARSVQAAFNDPQISIDGDTSTVAGLRTYSIVTQDGHRLSRSTKTTLTLRRSSDGWLIERVVHH